MNNKMTTTPSSVRISDHAKGYDLDKFLMPSHYKNDLHSVLLPHGLIQDRVAKLASDIYQDHEGQHITIICVLKGAYQFNSDLVNYMEGMNNYSLKGKSLKINREFIRLKSYENERSSGNVKIIGAEAIKVTGQNILIVEDIVDTGHTMVELLKYFNTQNPNKISIASLLIKRTPNVAHSVHVEYCGFEIPDRFVVGYGLDYNEHFRDLKHICVVNENGRRKYASDNSDTDN